MTTESILCLRLADGTELIAEVESINSDLVARNVLQIISIPDEQTQSMRMAITPFMPYTKGEFIIPGGAAMISSPSDDLENMHRERFGKIVLAKSSILTQ